MGAYLFVFALFITVCKAGVPLSRYEALLKKQSTESLGLYNSTDKVLILTNDNFKNVVQQQNYSTFVEFYNSYCGHCKRFAPTYKKLADELYAWRDVIKIAAIDCAAEENNDICREYEIMAYPTMRYISPGFTASKDNYGRPLETQILDQIRTTLAQWLAAENQTASTGWPDFRNLTELPFEGVDSKKQYVIIVYEPENTTIGIETILHFQRWPNVAIRRVVDLDAAAKYQIDGSQNKIASVDRKGNVLLHAPLDDTAKSYAETIEKFLLNQHITEKPTERTTVQNLVQKQAEDEVVSKENAAIVNEVLRNKHFVYQADLEMALRGILFNEIPKASNISGERLVALQRLLTVLHRYNPLGNNGKTLITKLYEYVMQFNEQISGKQFETELKRLEANFSPIFSSSRHIGCIPSQFGLRGFTCSIWQLFHYMTVQASRNENIQDPLEVLQAMHGFVKYFFGCTECSEHFQVMATRRKIWSTPNKDEAVLWLWAAHNEVNQRLAGDQTEDPKFPKIQFPSISSCSQCYKRPSAGPTSALPIDWDKDAVLSFLRNIYNPEYISRYGVDREDIIRTTVEKLRQKRMIGNVFSEMDMRMGMLLYGFCIIMIVVAFKLFAFKGYRKKPYGHDILGKV